MKTIQKLLSLPPGFSKSFYQLELQRKLPEWFVEHDPIDKKLGSGGGTAFLMEQAWKKTGDSLNFSQWLMNSQKIIIHGGGQSRRLPAYAPIGKLFTPIPVPRWNRGCRVDQKLIDLQLPIFQDIMNAAGDNYRSLIASGDVLNRFDTSSLKQLPEADVLVLGMWVNPDVAVHHGVFVAPKLDSFSLESMLQKPSKNQLQNLPADKVFTVDIGIWLLSEKAVKVLMQKCGWMDEKLMFSDSLPDTYDLYGQFGLHLGTNPSLFDEQVSDLSVAVYPLDDAQFLHFGKNSDLINSTLTLQNSVLDQRECYSRDRHTHSSIFTQNSIIKYHWLSKNKNIWIENSFINESWELNDNHILTGIPHNNWNINIPSTKCLDIIPIQDNQICIRAYGFFDTFSGPLNQADYQGINFNLWAKNHSITFDKLLSDDHNCDIQFAPIFPVLDMNQINQEFIQWIIDDKPSNDLSELYLNSKKLSANDISNLSNLQRIYQQREFFLADNLMNMSANYENSVFYQLDLAHTATFFSKFNIPIPHELTENADPMTQIQNQMFRAICNNKSIDKLKKYEKNAFDLLKSNVLNSQKQLHGKLKADILPDQILWGRSPVRIDLAGGWSDTPPYCMMNGGAVVNLAVDLNGQPPIQVFAKFAPEPVIILRSIDLGQELTIRDYADLQTYNKVGNAFSLPKAALALIGFTENAGYNSLKEHLTDFGGGIELTFLAAIPKGSGLGTSSILAATIIKVLSEMSGLKWDNYEVSRQVLIIEQMLTTGGGWQDQIGGLFNGIKYISSMPGFLQKPQVKWIADSIFSNPLHKECILLYYTGITRVAKNILAEIVRGMFLNSSNHLDIINRIHKHADCVYEALQMNDWNALVNGIKKSWQYNQMLDPGTNPPPVAAIIDLIKNETAALKLLGAGGGGYMIIFANNLDDASKIRKKLTDNPPNSNARFIDISISNIGTVVTRS
jgi:galactokinase/mevalonate kinase-like predicted kinase